MHRLAWMDVISTDIDCSLEYYGDLLGWTSERLPIDHGEQYRLVSSGGVIVAGAEQVAAERALLPTWTLMVEVDDAPAVIDAAVAGGAVETFALAPMLDLGRIAMLRDPWGATLGVWEPGTFRPSASAPAPGSLTGAVLTCSDPPAATEYHRNVFGWRDAIADCVLDAGVGVYIEHGDGPANWTPILRDPAGDGAEQGRRLHVDPMGARFFLRA